MASMMPENFQDWQKKIKFRRRRRRNLEKIRVSEPKNGHFWPKKAQFGQFWLCGISSSKIFRKFEIFSKNFRPDETPQAKIVDQKCNKNENFGVDETPQNPTHPREYLGG